MSRSVYVTALATLTIALLSLSGCPSTTQQVCDSAELDAALRRPVDLKLGQICQLSKDQERLLAVLVDPDPASRQARIAAELSDTSHEVATKTCGASFFSRLSAAEPAERAQLIVEACGLSDLGLVLPPLDEVRLERLIVAALLYRVLSDADEPRAAEVAKHVALGPIRD